MKAKTKMQIGFALAILVAGLAATVASASVVNIPPIPEPTSPLLFAAGLAVTAIAIRMVRRK